MECLPSSNPSHLGVCSVGLVVGTATTAVGVVALVVLWRESLPAQLKQLEVERLRVLGIKGAMATCSTGFVVAVASAVGLMNGSPPIEKINEVDLQTRLGKETSLATSSHQQQPPEVEETAFKEASSKKPPLEKQLVPQGPPLAKEERALWVNRLLETVTGRRFFLHGDSDKVATVTGVLQAEEFKKIENVSFFIPSSIETQAEILQLYVGEEAPEYPEGYHYSFIVEGDALLEYQREKLSYGYDARWTPYMGRQVTFIRGSDSEGKRWIKALNQRKEGYDSIQVYIGKQAAEKERLWTVGKGLSIVTTSFWDFDFTKSKKLTDFAFFYPNDGQCTVKIEIKNPHLLYAFLRNFPESVELNILTTSQETRKAIELVQKHCGIRCSIIEKGSADVTYRLGDKYEEGFVTIQEKNDHYSVVEELGEV